MRSLRVALLVLCGFFFLSQIVTPKAATLTGPPGFGVISGIGGKLKASAPNTKATITPNLLFGQPTSVKYPVFQPGGGFVFHRPLELCGTNPDTAVFDGAPGAPAVFCNVTGGRRSVSYDADGTNPTTLSPFGVHLFEGSAEVTPMYWSWFTGGTSNRIYGTGLDATFTPSVKPIFSHISSNNYVSVMVTYSSLYGRRTAICGTPIAVVKSGSIGVDGAPGPAGDAATIAVGTVTTVAPSSPATVVNVGTASAAIFDFEIPKGEDGGASITQAQILAEMDNQSTGILTMQGSADSDIKSQLLYSTGETSLWVTSGGLLFMQDKSGHITWGWDNDTKTMTFSNYSFNSTRKNMTVDRYGQVRRYAPNGTTLIYESYTTGRTIHYNKAGRQIMKLYTSGRLEL